MAITTVNATTPRREYTASGGQTVFSAPFEYFADADLLVYQVPTGVDPDDTAHLLTLTTHYTVSGADTSGGGNVTLVSGATAGDTIIIEAKDDIDRDTAFLANGDLTIASMNQELNKLIMLHKQLSMMIEERQLIFQHSELLDSIDLTIPKPVADRIFAVWNSAGTALELGPTAGEISAAQGYATAAAASAAAAAISESDADTHLTEFKDLYLGPKASAPSLDNSGNALTAGDLYFNTTTDDLWFYTGAAWQLYNSSAASSANTVSIADAGSYFGATKTVEAALQELGQGVFNQSDFTIESSPAYSMDDNISYHVVTGSIAPTIGDKAAGLTTVLVINNGTGGSITINYDADWNQVGSCPATLTTGQTAIFYVTCVGTADTDIFMECSGAF